MSSKRPFWGFQHFFFSVSIQNASASTIPTHPFPCFNTTAVSGGEGYQKTHCHILIPFLSQGLCFPHLYFIQLPCGLLPLRPFISHQPFPLLPLFSPFSYSSSKPNTFLLRAHNVPPFPHYFPSSHLLFLLSLAFGIHKRKGTWGLTSPSLWTSPFLQFLLFNQWGHGACVVTLDFLYPSVQPLHRDSFQL